MAKETPEDVQRLLKEVVDHFDKEDRAVRDRQIRTARRLKLIWEGFQRSWYSETAHDWRIWDQDTIQGDDTEQAYYDKPVNIFRAYLESIIAALSVTVPPVKCYPDDADSTLDLATAKAGDKIAQLVYRHNNVSLLWLHALFIYCTEGMVACYNYPKEDEKYGTYERSEYEDEEQYHQTTSCPNCQYPIDQQQIDPTQMTPQAANPQQPQPAPQAQGADVDAITDPILDEFMPENVDVQNAAMDMESEREMCPNCMQVIIPFIQQEKFIVSKLVGVTNEPKTRMCLEAYGLLYVKVANYAKNQEGTPYLVYSYETHFANAVERYAHLHGKKGLTADKIKASTGPKDPYEEWGRLNPQYQGEYPLNVVTVRNAWLRPAAFNVLSEKADVDKLKKLYPNGAKVVLVNEHFAEACNESLDDCWTITYNPLSDYIHFDPLGLLLVSLQEITNDIISLTLQTMEHGIGQTFADPGVLDFNAYRQLEATPGGVYEATPKSGKTIGESFYELKTASLSPEIMPFAQNVQNLAQLVSGALPSLFGGQLEGAGGDTASGYSMSRSQALQRLQNTWKIFTSWWKEIFGKTIPMFIKEVKADERDVQRTKDGNFINVLIRKAEMEGRIGRVELEANENLPMTWSQTKDVIMQLLQNANPEILAILGNPENLPIIREAIGLTDFFVPDEDQRDMQYDEIKQLLDSTPLPTMNPQMPEVPSVEVDQDYNNHGVHFQIVQKWVTGEAGRQAKVDNPDGYRNVLLHGKMHLMILQGQQMPQGPEQSGAANPEKPTESQMQPEAPITGDANVQTAQ